MELLINCNNVQQGLGLRVSDNEGKFNKNYPQVVMQVLSDL